MTIDPLSEDCKRGDETRRPYCSPRRRAQADATRAVIADAARRLFTEKGWAGTRVRDVARLAGVAEPTVYATFGSKAGLAHALVEAIGTAADLDRQTAELAAAHGDPAGQLAAMVGFDCRLYAGAGDVLAVLRDASQSEPELAEAYRAGRADGDRLRRAVLTGWPPGTLRLDLDEAVDVYAALCTVDVHRVLVQERRWTPQRVERWLCTTVTRLLLG